jgi:hypothetical protein
MFTNRDCKHLSTLVSCNQICKYNNICIDKFIWWRRITITTAAERILSFGGDIIGPELFLEEPREPHHLLRVRQDAPGGGVRGEAAAPPVQQRRGGRVDEGEPVEALAGPERRQEAAERQVQEPRRRVAAGEESRAAAAVPERLLQEPQRRAGVVGRLRLGGRGRAQGDGVQRRPKLPRNTDARMPLASGETSVAAKHALASLKSIDGYLVVDVGGPEAVHGALVGVLRQEEAIVLAAGAGGGPRGVVDVLDDDGGLADGAAVGEEQDGDLAVDGVGGEEPGALGGPERLFQELVRHAPQLQRQPRPRRERAHLPAQNPHRRRRPGRHRRRTMGRSLAAGRPAGPEAIESLSYQTLARLPLFEFDRLGHDSNLTSGWPEWRVVCVGVVDRPVFSVCARARQLVRVGAS